MPLCTENMSIISKIDVKLVKSVKFNQTAQRADIEIFDSILENSTKNILNDIVHRIVCT